MKKTLEKRIEELEMRIAVLEINRNIQVVPVYPSYPHPQYPYNPQFPPFPSGPMC